MLNGQVWAQQDPDVNCYEMVISTPIIEIYNTQAQGEIVLELPVENIITGRIQENSGQSYSFKITDSNNKVVQQGELVPSDGAFDQQTEEFEITVDSSLATGNYKLYFYECDLQTQKNNPDILSFCVYVLKVIETAVMCYFY